MKESPENRNHALLYIIIPVVVLLVIAYPWLHSHVAILLSPDPPAPINTYGEFPFRIEYEIEGERFEIEDVLIVEYVGRGVDDMKGKYLKWDGRLASGNELGYGLMSMLLGSTTEWRHGCSIKVLDGVPIGNGALGGVYIDVGSAPYYLGYYVLDGYVPGAGFNNGQGILDEEALWERYGIRIVEAEFSEPMVGNGLSPSNVPSGPISTETQLSPSNIPYGRNSIENQAEKGAAS